MERKNVGKREIAQTSNVSFSPSVFKRLVLHTDKNQGLFGKGLNSLNMIYAIYLCHKRLNNKDISSKSYLHEK